MAAVPRTFRVPKVPVTPSATINNMLKSRCEKDFSSPVKYAIAFYICMVFQAITTIYNVINVKKPQPSHTYWMVSCGIVSVFLVAKVSIIYHMIMSFDSLVYTLFTLGRVLARLAIRYGFIALALAAVGLGVSGMVFFDKEGEAATSNRYSTKHDVQTSHKQD